jgi:hypothetical protein
VVRAFQQFSRFRLGKESPTEHHFLQQDQVGQRRKILKALALELSEPGQGLREAEEPVLGLLLAAEAAGTVISAALCTFAIECRADYATIWPGQIPRV